MKNIVYLQLQLNQRMTNSRMNQYTFEDNYKTADNLYRVQRELGGGGICT